MWYRRRKRVVRRKRASSVSKHYLEHKEIARELVLARLEHFNRHYQLEWGRVSIKNQRRCWGSCSSLKNLNFSYKLFLLPACLRDYIIVHELCHLKEMNHGPQFWALVAEQVPDYQTRVRTLKAIERRSVSVTALEQAAAAHQGCTICLASSRPGLELMCSA